MESTRRSPQCDEPLPNATRKGHSKGQIADIGLRKAYGIGRQLFREAGRASTRANDRQGSEQEE